MPSTVHEPTLPAPTDNKAVMDCFHCGLPNPTDTPFTVIINNSTRKLCCVGCESVARAIVDCGMESYYHHRGPIVPGDSPAPDLVPSFIKQLESWDDVELQQQYVRHEAQGRDEITLMISGITCAACVWLIEHHLQRAPGIEHCKLNLASQRAEIAWDSHQISLSGIIKNIAAVGYKAEPYSPHKQEAVIDQENKKALARIGVAGLGTMQVMMFAVGLYAGAFDGIAENHETFLRIVSALVCLPVYLYAGFPFLAGAYRNIKARHAGMDVSVALAITAAYLSSLWSTYTHGPEVYFDSVCMFVFFLSVGRYLEMRVRHLSLSSSIRMANSKVVMALVLDGDDWKLRPADQLKVNDKVRVKAGEIIPGDGLIVEGISSINEAMLTGEEIPVAKSTGCSVTGGTLNIDNPITLTITRNATDSTLYALRRLLDRAQSEKPAITQIADRVSSYFVMAVIFLSIAVYAYWYQHAPEDAFWIVLSVLVVTCPCALSLATPAAITAATSRLSNKGFLPSSAYFIESFKQVTDVVFDKTGTLTEGVFSIKQIVPIVSSLQVQPQQQAKALEESLILIAASLESHSEHPIANAFVNALSSTLKPIPLIDIHLHTNLGIEGFTLTSSSQNKSRYRLGVAQFACGTQVPPLPPRDSGHWLLLSENYSPLAWFEIQDKIRPDADSLIRYLDQRGLVTHILSGDQSDHPEKVAQQLGIQHTVNGAHPEHKLAYIKQLQAQSRKVLMIGDGLNDAPVLAGADVSIAMATGTDLAKVAADAILLNHRISSLKTVFETIDKTYTVIQQNLSWAILYNMTALPLAAAGWIPPWMAAIGMSGSSLIVVLNALRIQREGGAKQYGADTTQISSS